MHEALKFIGITAALFAASLALALFILTTQQVQGSAPSGLYATVASSTQRNVSGTASMLMATTSNCAARVVTTASSSVMLTFSDHFGQTPSAILGHWQAASTTVAYDAGIYGCDRFSVYSFAPQLITITETR